MTENKDPPKNRSCSPWRSFPSPAKHEAKGRAEGPKPHRRLHHVAPLLLEPIWQQSLGEHHAAEVVHVPQLSATSKGDGVARAWRSAGKTKNNSGIVFVDSFICHVFFLGAVLRGTRKMKKNTFTDNDSTWTPVKLAHLQSI